MSEQEMQMKLASQQEKVKALRQEVAEMNKEREFWQQVRIQAAIAAMQGMLSGEMYNTTTIELAKSRGQDGTQFITKMAVEFADTLVAELKKGGQDDNNH